MTTAEQCVKNAQLAIPNFYFHASMVYAILRHNGVDLGKMDYIGSITIQDGGSECVINSAHARSPYRLTSERPTGINRNRVPTSSEYALSEARYDRTL